MKWKVLYAKERVNTPNWPRDDNKKQRQLSKMMTCSESKRGREREEDRDVQRERERASVSKLAKVSVVREATNLGH